MKPEYRALIFTLTLLVAAPCLYQLGDWLGGIALAVSLPAAASLAALLYAGRGEGPKPPAAGGA